MSTKGRLWLRAILALTLALPIFIFTPSASAAECSVISGTVSGTTRYAKITSGNGCTWTVPSGVTSIQYLIVGGGGGGGGAGSTTVVSNLGGGGGGAGGVVNTSTLSVASSGTLTLAVGVGGSAGGAGSAGSTGGTTTLSYLATTITSTGGYGGAGSPGTGNQDTLSGDGGSNASYSGGVNVWDGGGGGAGAGGPGGAGSDIGGQGGNGGAGGVGVASSLLGSPYYYGGGGGGGGTPSTNANESDGTGAAGGSSVGGNGGGTVGGVAGTLATSGAVNTGSGGGGGGWRYSYTNAYRAGGAGADGVIIIIYAKATSTVSSVSITSNSGIDNTYKTGDLISLTFVMSEAVTVTGTPRAAVFGLTSKYFSYSTGSGTTSLIFTYIVLNSDSASAGVGLSANVLELNGGTILDTAGIPIALSHSSIARSTSHQVDGIVPTITGIQTVSVAENNTYTETITASEPGYFRWVGVNDNALFTFDTQTGVLTLSSRDFENPQDADLNNVYYVSIAYTDLAGNPSGNYNFNFTITNVLEVASVGSPSLSGAAVKGLNVTITVTSDVAGKADFYWNGKRIPKCIGISTTGTSPNIVANCIWKPSSTAPAKLRVTIRPTSSSYLSASSPSISVIPTKRQSLR